MNDLRFALRQLLKNPGFTAVAVLTLALGIGATTAIFSVVYGVLISPYPYAKPGEIWTPGLHSANANQTMRPYRPGEYQEMARLPAFADVMATGPGSVLLTGEYAPETIRGIRVSGNAFRFLGVPPLFGRTIQPSDIRPSGEPEPVVVLSYRRWQKLFGNDTGILGKTLRLDDQPYNIIGVMPPRFGWWTDDGVWTGLDAHDQRGVFPIVRLKPGVSSDVARQQLHVLHLELAKANPAGFPREKFVTSLTNYLDITQASGEMQRSLWLLFGAVAFLLLIACANVANLQLARASSRGREMAVRLAVGAGRVRLIRQLLTENVLLSLLGGLLGLGFAVWITKLTVTLMPSFNFPNEARIEVNGHILMFCLVVSMLTGLLFGLAPALQASRSGLANALKDEARGSIGPAGGGMRASLVVAEVALSVMLLVSAGLTIRSFIALQQVRLGFQPERVLTVVLPLPPKRYATWERRNQFARELLDRIRSLPGVQAATIGIGGLPFGGVDSTYSIEGQVDSQERRLMFQMVGADYLRTLGIPLRRGRMLSKREIDRADPVAVLNEAAVKLWPAGVDPIGKLIRLDQLTTQGGSVLAPTNRTPYVRVIGVVGDARNDNLRNNPQPAVLVPYTLLAPPQRVLAVRTQGNPASLMNALRAQVHEMDPEQPMAWPATIEEILHSATAQPRFTMALFSLFAALGLALAMAGVYGVLAYLVTLRTREIGVRMALGAQRSDVLGLVLGIGGRLVGAGVAIGLLCSLGVTRFLASRVELFEVKAVDPVSFLGVAVLLATVALVACWLPAHRATKVDPMEALRCG